MRKLIVLACILSFLVSATGLVGCAIIDNGPQSPKQVVEEFLGELETGDTNTAWDMLSAKTQKSLGSEDEFDSLVNKTLGAVEQIEKIEVGKTTIDHNTATVTTTAIVNGKKKEGSQKLVKEDGVWKITLVPE
jgi:methylmalonyl-CoA mutase N-terminal domain/subunit